jgi:hypothetical protein
MKISQFIFLFLGVLFSASSGVAYSNNANNLNELTEGAINSQIGRLCSTEGWNMLSVELQPGETKGCWYNTVKSHNSVFGKTERQCGMFISHKNSLGHLHYAVSNLSGGSTGLDHDVLVTKTCGKDNPLVFRHVNIHQTGDVVALNGGFHDVLLASCANNPFGC